MCRGHDPGSTINNRISMSSTWTQYRQGHEVIVKKKNPRGLDRADPRETIKLPDFSIRKKHKGNRGYKARLQRTDH